MQSIFNVKIKSIKKIESEEMFDITVAKNHNLFYNKILIHNSGYRGELIFRFKVIPFMENPVIYKDGERIGQFRLHKKIECKLVEGYVSTETERGTGGFGSSGK